MYKGTFRFSSRLPNAFTISYELLHIIFYNLNILIFSNKTTN